MCLAVTAMDAVRKSPVETLRNRAIVENGPSQVMKHSPDLVYTITTVKAGPGKRPLVRLSGAD